MKSFWNSLNVDLLSPLRQQLESLPVQNLKQARWVCKLIPARCPFERDIKVFNRTVFSIPPLCKLNPLYDQLIALRFRSLTYLADECGEDISLYC